MKYIFLFDIGGGKKKKKKNAFRFVKWLWLYVVHDERPHSFSRFPTSPVYDTFVLTPSLLTVPRGAAGGNKNKSCT